MLAEALGLKPGQVALGAVSANIPVQRLDIGSEVPGYFVPADLG